MNPYYGPSSLLLQGADTAWIGLLSMVFYLLFWAVVIILAYRFVRNNVIGKTLSRKDTSLIILRERYAKGEIDRSGFLEKQADLADGDGVRNDPPREV